MKKLICILLLVCMICTVAYSEETKVTFHDAFGLSYGATDEQICEAVTSVFNARRSEDDKSMYFVSNAFLYDIPVSWITGSAFTSEWNGKLISHVTVSLDDDQMNAENVLKMYRNLCSLYGDPTLFDIKTETITMSGSGKTDIQIDDVESIQKAIDRANIYGLVCWDNISLEFDAYMSNVIGTERKIVIFQVDAAFSEASLPYQITILYGLTDK